MADTHPSSGEILGNMYKRSVLDCVIDAAYAVANDFSSRPELYRDVSDNTAIDLLKLQSLTGFQTEFPSHQIREKLYRPIFGRCDADMAGEDGSPFHVTRMEVLAAAVAFSENAQPIGFPMLRERLRSAIVPFRTHMRDVFGTSLLLTNKRISSMFGLASRTLRDQNVAAVFGIQKQIDQNWPLDSNDTEGAKLIAYVAIQLAETSLENMTRDKFVRLQRAADEGDKSIRFILEGDVERDTIDAELMPQLYAWGSELGLINKMRT